MDNKCPYCGAEYESGQAPEICAACGRRLTDRAQEPEGTDTAPEPEAAQTKRRKKPKEVVAFTEDSPIWESQRGRMFFLLRAWKTADQIIKRPERTFAAPRSAYRKSAFRFLLLCYVPPALFIFLNQFIATRHETNLSPLVVALVVVGIPAVLMPPAVWLMAHVTALLFHGLCIISYRKCPGYTVSYQVWGYISGVAILAGLVLVLIPEHTLMYLGWPNAAFYPSRIMSFPLLAIDLFIIFGAAVGGLGMPRKRAWILVVIMAVWWLLCYGWSLGLFSGPQA